jgi:hypothetical protein
MHSATRCRACSSTDAARVAARGPTPGVPNFIHYFQLLAVDVRIAESAAERHEVGSQTMSTGRGRKNHIGNYWKMQENSEIDMGRAFS